MKKLVLSMITMLTWGCVAYAQPAWIMDTLSMGTSSASDVYYSMTNGSARVENNKNWHLGFSMNAGDSSAIWANHNSGNAFVKVYNIHKDTSMWASVTLADTANEVLNNTDAGWYAGALNNKPGVSPFDFGWGKYDPVSHNIVGDSLFIVKANNTFYKLWVKELVSTAMTYTFRVEDMTTNTDTTYTIVKAPKYSNNLFAYFNLATGADTNREPAINDWDLQFTRYSTTAPGSGPFPNNNVIGALSNKGVKIAKAYPAHVDTAYVNYANYIATWASGISGVGYNWKTYDQPTNTWSVEDSTSYFVQDKAGNLWQMMFASYSGSSTGNIILGKRMVAPTSVNDIESAIAQFSIYPNPASSKVNVVLDAKKSTTASMYVYDMTGRIVLNSNLMIRNGLTAYQLPVETLTNGNYILSIQGEGVKIAQTLQIQK